MKKLSEILAQRIWESKQEDKIRETFGHLWKSPVWNKVIAEIEFDEKTYPDDKGLEKKVTSILKKHMKEEHYGDEEISNMLLIKTLTKDIISYLEDDRQFTHKREYEKHSLQQ